jgi:hypothetical protein
MTVALGLMMDWLKKLTPLERMAVFGALQDRWCHACGVDVELCKCRRYNRTMKELTRSTANSRKRLDAIASMGCKATTETVSNS